MDVVKRPRKQRGDKVVNLVSYARLWWGGTIPRNKRGYRITAITFDLQSKNLVSITSSSTKIVLLHVGITGYK
jgi:hypothetical protein